jgi:hypothetical protein
MFSALCSRRSYGYARAEIWGALGQEADVEKWWLVLALALTASGCPQPDSRDPEACMRFAGCGECVGQPQCGWCMDGAEGRCVPNRGEDERDEPPAGCGEGKTWHYRIRDDPALPSGAPYCPEVPDEDDEDDEEEATSGHEEDA